uniref:Uncharacterized protein n=1 Tax=viral metagenome TaxID=1070528 RepID=A0A6C0BD50_9ZZZZ
MDIPNGIIVIGILGIFICYNNYNNIIFNNLKFQFFYNYYKNIICCIIITMSQRDSEVEELLTELKNKDGMSGGGRKGSRKGTKKVTKKRRTRKASRPKKSSKKSSKKHSVKHSKKSSRRKSRKASRPRKSRKSKKSSKKSSKKRSKKSSRRMSMQESSGKPKRKASNYIIDVTKIKAFIRSKLSNENLNKMGPLSKVVSKLFNDNNRDVAKTMKNFDADSFLKDYKKAVAESGK